VARGGLAGALLGVTILVCAAFAWPAQGFDAARTSASPSDDVITPSNVANLAPSWSAKLPGPGKDPVVADGHVYVASASNRKPVGDLDAFRVAGTRRCRAPRRLLCRASWSLQGSGISSLSPPALVGGSLYEDAGFTGTCVASGEMDVYRASSGAFVKELGRLGTAASPVIAGGIAYFDTLLETCGSGPVWSTEAVKASTGAILFVTQSPSSQPLSPPALGDGTVYEAAGDTLLAYNAAGVTNCTPGSNGEPTTCDPLWEGTLPGPINGTPAVAGNSVFVSTDRGVLEAFPANGCAGMSCSPTWTGVAGRGHVSPPALSGTRIFVGTGSGRLDVFRTGGCGRPSCAPVWESQRLGGAVGPPSVAGQLVYVGTTTGKLAAFDTTGCVSSVCSPRWSTSVRSAVTTAPAIAGGRVFVSEQRGLLQVLAIRHG
jgi:hypothetical protein